jgi:hypothetical protein
MRSIAPKQIIAPVPKVEPTALLALIPLGQAAREKLCLTISFRGLQIHVLPRPSLLPFVVVCCHLTPANSCQ